MINSNLVSISGMLPESVKRKINHIVNSSDLCP